MSTLETGPKTNILPVLLGVTAACLLTLDCVPNLACIDQVCAPAFALGATGTLRGLADHNPARVGEWKARFRARATLVDAVPNAPADVGSIPTVSTRRPLTTPLNTRDGVRGRAVFKHS